MPLIKLRNDGEVILFVDSLSLTLRPKEVKHFDEETAKNDMQLMRCVIAGTVKMCNIDQNFEDAEKTKEISETSEKVLDSEKKPDIKKAVRGRENPDQGVVEPKNTTPVVMFGEKPSRRQTYSGTNMQMPDYINPDDIIGVAVDAEKERLSGDIEDSDIIYVDG